MKFLVAYDSSPTAKVALERTLRLLRRDTDSVVVLMISEQLPELLLTEETVQRITAARLNDAMRVMKSLSDILTAEQIVHETIATPAYDTAQEILDQAASCEADMIVLGSRGMGTIQGLLLGSVSQRCLNDAQVPVMIVHQAQGDTPSTIGGEASPASTLAAH